MSVQVYGLDEVLRMLEQELPRAAKKMSADLTMDVAKAIADDAKARAPVRSGRMQSAIKARRSADDEDMAEVYVKRGKGGAFHWRFLEYGQGPDGAEHAFFLKARESVLGDGRFTEKFRRKLTAMLKRL
jgi:HK97 gp10 family phage protein